MLYPASVVPTSVSRDTRRT